MSTLPNLIVIGAVKCGTSSLHYYLNLHPDIMMSRIKELYFFVDTHNWNRGIDWYKSHFKGDAKIFGESSPGYTVFPGINGVPKKMYSVIPEAKLIYIVRDPIERIKSAYIHRLASGKEDRSINDALRNFDNNSYIYTSMYYFQLEQFFSFYNQNSIFILTLEELIINTAKSMSQIFKFLNIDDTFNSIKYNKILNKSSKKRLKNRIGLLLKRFSNIRMASFFSENFKRQVGSILYIPFSQKIPKPEINPQLEDLLKKYLSEDVKRLKQFTGKSLFEWKNSYE